MNHPLLIDQLQRIDNQARWRICSKPIRSRECSLFRAESAESGHVIAIKAYNPSVSLAAPKKQYEALHLKQGAMTRPKSPYRVPTVYSFDKNEKTLLMDWANGKSLKHILWFDLRSGAMNEAVSLTGRWLREFHSTPQSTEGQASLSSYLSVVEKRLKLTGSSPSEPFFVETLETLAQCAKGAKHTATLAIPHGDFTPYNLLIGGDTVTGIDLWGLKKKPIYNDLARMTVYLSIAYPLFFRGVLFDSQGSMHPTITQLYTAYGPDKVDTRSQHLKVALLSEYLRRWIVIANRQSDWLRRLTDRHQIWRIQQQIKSILATI